MFDPCFVMQYLVSFSFCNHFAEAEAYFFIVFLVCCKCWSSLALPHCAVGCSAVCDCGISWSYLPFFTYV